MQGDKRSYEVVGLDELLTRGIRGEDGLPVVEVFDGLPDVDVPLSPIAFGQTGQPKEEFREWPSGGWTNTSYRAQNGRAFRVRNARIHGEQGIVTVEGFLLTHTLYHVIPERAGFTRLDDRSFSGPAGEADLVVDVGAHLLCGWVGNRNYAHWWVDVVPALLVRPFSTIYDNATLIWPQIRAAYQAETLALLPETIGRSVFLSDAVIVNCRSLLMVPSVTTSDPAPHPHRMNLVRAVKERVGAATSCGSARIYVSRKDATARPLINEKDVSALLRSRGFQIVTLSDLSLADQIRLFSSASHVVGPHGAGLANVMFCNEGSALLELQMSSHVVWTIRSLASLAGMRYGCVLGTADKPDDRVDSRSWSLSLLELEKTLDDHLFSKI